MNQSIQLRGITWDHTRGYVPMTATAQRYHELHPDVEITWSKRSLQEFADKPLGGLSEQFDLLVIDNPWMGFVAAHKNLLALETHLPSAFLADQAANSVGKSHESYLYAGSQWALAIDSATPVAAYRPDLLAQAGATVPRTFDELIALGKRGLVCCPSIPLDVYGNFLNLLVAAGEQIFANPEEVAAREPALVALERLKQLADVVPARFFELNPIRTHEVMSREDQFAYCPYTYGYTNYARRGYAPKLLKFGDVVGLTANRPGSTMLGGTGLAISAGCRHPEIAADYAMFCASPAIQRGIYFESGGQPSHRTAWLDADTNAVCSSFFLDTLPTLDRAFVRPRYNGYVGFQDHAGEPIHEFLRLGGSAGQVIDKINTLYRKSHQI